MKRPPMRMVLAGLTLMGVSTVAQAALIHRFSFNGTAKDAVGTANGTLKGDGAKIADGQLVLTNTDAASGDKISFLEFSEPLLPKSGNSASFVVWFTCKDIGGFARVLNFGDSESGEGKQFIYFSPKTAESMARAAITAADVGSKTYLDFDPLDDGKPHMVAFVVDGAAKKLRIFVDDKDPKPAEDLGENTLDKVKPVENWLGKSSFVNDPGLTATIDELRVYDQALTAEDAVAAFKAGPNTVAPVKPSAPPATNAAPTTSAPAGPTTRSGRVSNALPAQPATAAPNAGVAR